MVRTSVDDLYHWASTEPDRTAVALGAFAYFSYGELAGRVARLASALAARGLGPGRRMGLLSENHPLYFEALLAAWHCGAAAVPVNARLTEAETCWILRDADVSLTVASAALSAQAAAAGGPVLTLGSPDWEALAAEAPLSAPVPQSKGDLAWLFYTSGTTGRPKGAMITHGNLAAMCRGYFASVDPVAPWPAILHPAPLSHGSGLYALAILQKGGVQVVPHSGGFDEAEMEALVRAWPGAVVFAAPTILRRLRVAGADLSLLKAAIYGGAPMAVAEVAAFLRAYGPKLAQLYGQGEAPMTISALTAKALGRGDARLWESAGYAQEGVELRLGTGGEVELRGDIVCAGYWRNAEATEAAFAGGWLKTGDVGRLDADGLLTLVDRSKDLIISGGYNIYPREIEEVLAAHPGVEEVSVVSRPDAEYGEAVVAYVVARDVDAEALDAACLARLARYKRPRHYRFVEALPRNAYGKVLKTELRARERG